MQATYNLTGMSCDNCARKIEQGLSPFADKVTVNFAQSTVSLENATLSYPELEKEISKIGNYKLKDRQQALVDVRQLLTTYYPLLLILSYIGLVSFAGAVNSNDWMRHFMAGFFMVFSFFKLLDLKGFASAYAKYDLLAGQFPLYGFIYPFFELALGCAYLWTWHIRGALWATLILMGFGSLGVFRSMTRKETVRCACLGSVLNLPVSVVTLTEDLGMAVMAYLLIVNL